MIKILLTNDDEKTKKNMLIKSLDVGRNLMKQGDTHPQYSAAVLLALFLGDYVGNDAIRPNKVEFKPREGNWYMTIDNCQKIYDDCLTNIFDLIDASDSNEKKYIYHLILNELIKGSWNHTVIDKVFKYANDWYCILV